MSSTIADTLWMSLFVVKMVIPPDTDDREEYRENLSGDNVSLLFLSNLPLDVRLGSSVSRKFT